jgi:hypothetical protein
MGCPMQWKDFPVAGEGGVCEQTEFVIGAAFDEEAGCHHLRLRGGDLLLPVIDPNAGDGVD